MASNVVIGDTLQIKIYCKFRDQIGLNVRYLQVTNTTGASVTDQEVADRVALDVDALYRELLSIQARFEGVSAQIVLPVARDTVYSNNGAGAGLTSGDPLPSQTCGLITLRSGFAGRSGRGRMYIPFPGEGDNDTVNATPSASYMDKLAVLGEYFESFAVVTVGANSATMRWVITNYPDPAPGFVGILDTIPRQKWATQRRRGAFGRPNSLPF